MSADIGKIARYEVLQTIGRGGFATVYLGRDPYISRMVALKVSDAPDASAQQPAIAKLFQEAAAAGGLVHPNIVTIYDAGIDGANCYIAMEYVEGTTLHRHTFPGDLLPVADTLDVMMKVCHGLDYAHQRGVVHRDVKPSNILLGAHGEIKIADFGLACFKEFALADRKTVGTPSYMPPEQVEAQGSTPRSDLFSVGVILYQLLSGAKPFEGKDSLEMRRNIVKQPHIPLADRNPELPPELYAIVDRALAKKPEDRYPSGFDFARDLEGVLHGSHGAMGSELAERVKSLRQLSFFEDFSDQEIARILSIGAWLTHGTGDAVVREDEAGGAFFVIAAGEADITVGGKDMGRVARGDCFGEMAFLLGRKRSATIRARSEMSLLKLNPEKIDVLDPAIQIKIYRRFARTIAGFLLKAEGKA